MYKTVRHGENSLQYTILPQTEEVLNNSGLKGKGRDYSPSVHVRRSQRRSTVKYILLILFGIVVALALAAVPLYVMNGALYARRTHQNHEISTGNPLAPAGREIVKSRKKELKMTPMVIAHVQSETQKPLLAVSETTTTSTTVASVTSTTAIPKESRVHLESWPMSAIRPWQSTVLPTTIPPIPTEDNKIPLIGTPSGSIRLLESYMAKKPWEDIIIKPTVSTEKTTFRSVFWHYSRPSEKSITSSPSVAEDVLITTKATTSAASTTGSTTSTTTESSKLKDLKETILSVDDDDDFKESLEVDEVFSLPPLKPETSTGGDSDEVTVSKTAGGWYPARWPFVDTSSYFQWTEYSAGDNLLLPLLVAALSSIGLVLLLALAVRRRKRTQSASAQIGKLTADLQTDDNTNLLAAENPDDGEE